LAGSELGGLWPRNVSYLDFDRFAIGHAQVFIEFDGFAVDLTVYDFRPSPPPFRLFSFVPFSTARPTAMR
jgi:hypothetical protein